MIRSIQLRHTNLHTLAHVFQLHVHHSLSCVPLRQYRAWVIDSLGLGSDVRGMENRSVEYDSLLRCSVWEYRDRYRDQIIVLINACIQNHIIVEYLDCDFVGVRMVTSLFGMGVEWLDAYFVLNVRCSSYLLLITISNSTSPQTSPPLHYNSIHQTAYTLPSRHPHKPTLHPHPHIQLTIHQTPTHTIQQIRICITPHTIIHIQVNSSNYNVHLTFFLSTHPYNWLSVIYVEKVSWVVK